MYVDEQSQREKAGETAMAGGLLMVAYLLFDGLTSTHQESVFRRFRPYISSFHLMFFVNIFSLLAAFFCKYPNSSSS